MPIEFAIKILLILLQFKGLVFFSWLQSVTVSIFHVRHSVNYYYEEDDDHIDDDNDDDDDDDGKNSNYESCFTSNSHEVQTVKLPSPSPLPHRLFFSRHSNR